MKKINEKETAEEQKKSGEKGESKYKILLLRLINR